MSQKERTVIVAVLALIALMVGFDLYTDSKEGVEIFHVLVEGGIGLVSLFGVFYLIRGSLALKHQLQQSVQDFSHFRKEAETWREKARKYVEGLSESIDLQLSKWNLTVSEKEVAFLLLKGLSLKEVATIRNTSEKTARVQSMAVYAKSGLAGRSELSAFFLEDLLLPGSSPLTQETIKNP